MLSKKLLERLVSEQLVKYLTNNRLLPDQQSAYRRFHCTETAVLRVLSDIFDSSRLWQPGDVNIA